MFTVLRPNLYVSDCEFTVPWLGSTAIDTVDKARLENVRLESARQLLKTHAVKTIINVASDVHPTAAHHTLYFQQGIDYVEAGIKDVDSTSELHSFDFIGRVLRYYRNHVHFHGYDAVCVISCQAGVNRSALAAAVILWKSGAYETSHDVVADMRAKHDEQQAFLEPQKELLTNAVFEEYFHQWASTCQELRMYFFVRADLGMSKGKIAAQVGHGVQYLCMKRPVNLDEYAMCGSTKICLKVAGLDELNAVEAWCREHGILCAAVVDYGRTQLERNTKTVVAVGPVTKQQVAEVVAGKKLL